MRYDDYEELLAEMPEPLPSNIREVPGWSDGLRQADQSTTAAFDDACAQLGLARVFGFITANVNPGGWQAMAGRLLEIVLDPTQPWVLNLNCGYCAKAVDDNLQAMLGKPVERKFTVVDAHTATGVGQTSVHPDAGCFLDSKSGSLSDTLRAALPKGQRGLFSAPIRGRSDFTHYLNVVHTADGRLYVLDGQFGKLYDLDDSTDCKRFDLAYGFDGHNRDLPCMLSFTGLAPSVPADEFEMLDRDDVLEQGEVANWAQGKPAWPLVRKMWF